MGLGIPTLKYKIVLESNPLISRTLVRRLAANSYRKLPRHRLLIGPADCNHNHNNNSSNNDCNNNSNNNTVNTTCLVNLAVANECQYSC